MIDIMTLQNGTTHSGILLIVFTMSVAFLLSVVIGITYIKTFRGLSYSRTYVQAVILSSIVAATVVHAIGDSLARGLGMIGALAIIRFRTSFKDSRDILFMFSALAAGIGCGVGAFNVAVVGTAGFVATAWLLHITPLGQQSAYDGMLRFNITSSEDNRYQLEILLQKYCRTFALITLRDMQQGERLDYAYHVKMKKNRETAALIKELPEKIPSARGVGLMLQETTVEI